ncbi:uncharacterized protein LOC128202210 [Galleria mellonella]|uniref:Uncharacterized protein LOC128202210 n=1 Tax=Galleria mellonella TaxID=7137 RepID=A0ABM3N200_GALME|nr:uncharacterized protein LOC128202210 [Galleria mellonella]
MIHLMNMTVTVNKKEIDKLAMEVNVHPTHMVKFIEEFQKRANTTLTNLIEDRGESNEDIEDEDNDGDEDEEENIHVSPKKRKK